MAIKKQVTADNGIVTEYHRISMIKSDTNEQCTILVHSYLNEKGRQYEKDYAAGLIEGEPTFPYVDGRYITTNYSSAMTISRAYQWLKDNLPEFKGAEDVFENGEEPPELSGEEIIAMIEEVL